MNMRSLLLLPLALADTSFVTIGDWGGAALKSKDWYKTTVDKVAKAMADQAEKVDAEFIVNTGDNFYWCGIQNVSDYQIHVDYMEPYLGYDSLNIPWYNSLGNHEYGYNVTAQIDLSNYITTWIMPGRWYSKRIALDTSGEHHLSLIIVDTNPCIQEYRDDDPNGWDPCSARFPTCSIVNGHDNFEGPCKFHENIVDQDCSEQKKAVEKMLKAVPDEDWLIIVGHHPSDELDVEDFTTLYQKHGFDLYLNGHTHTLNHYSVDGDEIYITSGAGALVETDTQTAESTPHKQRIKMKSNGLNLEYNGHTYKTVFNKKVAGFVSHTFSSDFSSLSSDFYTYEGDVIHSFTVQRGDRLARRERFRAAQQAKTE